MRHLNFIFTASITLLATALVSTYTHAANGKDDPVNSALNDAKVIVDEIKNEQWVHVRNADTKPLKVYWTAAGCAGIPDGIAVTCRSEVAQPGTTVKYKFNIGTSSRNLRIRDAATPKASVCQADRDINPSQRFAKARDQAVTDHRFVTTCGRVHGE